MHNRGTRVIVIRGAYKGCRGIILEGVRRYFGRETKYKTVIDLGMPGSGPKNVSEPVLFRESELLILNGREMGY
jgi:hypothetical protein